MANITKEVGTQLIFADHATDFVGGASLTSLEVATATDVQLDTTSVADDAARESAQVDLGANRAERYSFAAALEMAATPVTGTTIDFYWNASPISTAGNGNMGYTVGVDGAYAGGVGTLDEGLAQLILLGSVVLSADATTTVQVSNIGGRSHDLIERFGSLIVVNRSGAAFHSDAVETHVVANPVIRDVAAS